MANVTVTHVLATNAQGQPLNPANCIYRTYYYTLAWDGQRVPVAYTLDDDGYWRARADVPAGAQLVIDGHGHPRLIAAAVAA